MGFIEERIGHQGYDGLAERLLESTTPRWPDRIKVRPLGNALRQLDQGERRKWIHEPSGQRLVALAAALRMSEAELRELLDDDAAPSEGSLIPLIDLPEARPLDIGRERLFPGIPDEVFDPQTWTTPVWWLAMGGSGRTLVGRWLETRGRARFIRASDPRAALQSIGSGLPTFVEIDQPDGIEQLTRDRLPPGVRICVAAPFPPPGWPPPRTESRPNARRAMLPDLSGEARPPQTAPHSWSVIETPPLDAWAGPLLRWVEPRLSRETAFKFREAAEVVADFAETLHTPGDVLALCGLMDQWGAEKVGSGEWKALRHAVELAFQRLPADNAFRATLVDDGQGLKLLLALVRATQRYAEPLITMDDLLERGLTRERWTALVPEDLAPPPDPQAARQLLLEAKAAGHALDPAALEVALSPGPELLIRGMVAAKLLESQREGRLVFRMRWLLRWVEQHSLDDLGTWPAEQIGDAILHPGAWMEVTERLLQLAVDGDWSAVLEAVAGWRLDNPARVAALEAAFLVTGLALMMGQTAPDGLCQELWKRQLHSLTGRFEGHHRLSGLLPVADSGWGTPFDRETWALAAIAVAEYVPELRLSGLDRGLAPWGDDDASEALRVVLRHHWTFWVEQNASKRKDDAVYPWTDGAFAMGARLLARHGPLTRHDNGGGPPCLLFLPALLARHILEPASTDIGSWELGWIPFRVLIAEAERNGISEDAFLSALWQLASQSNALSTHLDNILTQQQNQAMQLWRSCPPEELARQIDRHWIRAHIPWDSLTDEQWHAAQKTLRRVGLHGGEAERMWAQLPWAVFEQWTHEGADWQVMNNPAQAMWTREPDRMRQLARQALPGNPAVSWLLWTMPFETFMGELEEWLHHDMPLRLHVTSRLHGRVGRREPGWRDAWAWLQRLQAEPVEGAGDKGA